MNVRNRNITSFNLVDGSWHSFSFILWGSYQGYQKRSVDFKTER